MLFHLESTVFSSGQLRARIIVFTKETNRVDRRRKESLRFDATRREKHKTIFT